MSFIRTSLTATAFVLVAAGSALADNGVVASCAPGQTFTVGTITVSGAFVPATPKGAPTAAAYMSIANSGDADTLTGAASAAGNLTLHQMKQNGSVLEMARVEGGLTVPANGSVSLDPTSYHLMLTGLAQPLAEGQCVDMTLHFAKAGDLNIELNVGAIGSKVAPGASENQMSQPMDMNGMGSMPGM